MLYEDKQIQIEFKSENKFGRGRAAMRITSKLGLMEDFQAKMINDGGLKFQLSNPVIKETYADMLLSYSNEDVMISLPEIQFFYKLNNQP